MNNLFEEFGQLRKILCICPCCGEIVRVSDLHLRIKGHVAKTWLDNYESKIIAVSKEEEKFEEKEKKLREKAVEEGRKEATKVVNNVVLPIFRKLKLNQFDVKPILNPVDFVIFNGMTEKNKIKDIIFLSRVSKIKSINDIREQIKQAVKNKSYSFQVGRIENSTGDLSFE